MKRYFSLLVITVSLLGSCVDVPGMQRSDDTPNPPEPEIETGSSLEPDGSQPDLSLLKPEELNVGFANPEDWGNRANFYWSPFRDKMWQPSVWGEYSKYVWACIYDEGKGRHAKTIKKGKLVLANVSGASAAAHDSTAQYLGWGAYASRGKDGKPECKPQ